MYNASGALLASSNPSGLLTANFNLSLTAGKYYIRLDGVGQGNPFSSTSQGYTDYGSLGQYSIHGEITAVPSTSIESQGTAALLTTTFGYQVQGNGAAAQFVRYKGNLVSASTFAGWSAIGVEKLGQGYRLLWKHTDGRYSDWRVDSNGNYQSSPAIGELDIMGIEGAFQQDLNGDGNMGLVASNALRNTPLEANGDISQSKGLNDYDSIVGGPGNNTLVGGIGNDILSGSDGVDRFMLSNLNHGADIITDFVSGIDVLQISAAEFGGDLMGNTYLTSEQFGLGSAATTNQQRFLYEQSSGHLLYDSDGISEGASIHIATLRSTPSLSHQDVYLTL